MSDAPSSHTTIPILGNTVREVQALLPDEGALQEATNALLLAGFDRADLSLPSPQGTMSEAGETQPSDNPVDGRDARQARTLANSTIGVAGALIGGAVASVATGGAILPVAAAAIAAGAGAGGLTHMGFQGAADARAAGNNAKGAAGQLMLSALVRDAEKEKLAVETLRHAGASNIETVERTGSETRPAGISRS